MGYSTPQYRKTIQRELLALFGVQENLGAQNITGPPAADPSTGIIYTISRTNCGWRTIVPGEERDILLERPTGVTIADYAVGLGTPNGVRGPRGLPLEKPPYSRITAIDLNTGEHLWWIPNGGTPRFVQEHPALSRFRYPADRQH
ncbi:MAG: hypothetical protein Ct9H90mP25_1480 [Gammaproteobacteria bacterium]|nr:MAG: hypothetical protein Ct9H90mP25_1480 [Gammaproteobacteria bacterium]